MPVYDVECSVCGDQKVIYRTVDTRDQDLPLCCDKPMSRIISGVAGVMADIQPYRSMITGEMITSRSKHREHLRDHRCIEVGNETEALMKQHKDVCDRNVRPVMMEAIKEGLRKDRMNAR